MELLHVEKVSKCVHEHCNVWFEKISIPSPWLVTGNSKGVAGLKRQHFLKENMKPKWNFWKGGGRAQTTKPTMGRV